MSETIENPQEQEEGQCLPSTITTAVTEIIMSRQDNDTVTIECIGEGTTGTVFENIDFPECGIITLFIKNRGDA